MLTICPELYPRFTWRAELLPICKVFLVNFLMMSQVNSIVFLWTFLCKRESDLLWTFRLKLGCLHYLCKTYLKVGEQQKRSKWRIPCKHSLQDMTGFYEPMAISWISEDMMAWRITHDSLQWWPCLTRILEKHTATHSLYALIPKLLPFRTL